MKQVLYHGTTIEKAISILKQGIIKGNKRYQNQVTPMFSFSNNISSARDFGEIVLCFTDVENYLVEVEYENEVWIQNNPDILEYMYGGRFEDIQKDIKEFSLIHEQEYVGKGELSFLNNQACVHIQVYDEHEGQAAKNSLTKEFPNLKIQLTVLTQRHSSIDADFKLDFTKQIDELMRKITQVSKGESH